MSLTGTPAITRFDGTGGTRANEARIEEAPSMAARKIAKEFQDFISRGSVVDLAVGVIVGGAFTTVVNSLVANIIQPLISFITGGGAEIPGLALDLNGNIVDFGAFLSAVINFLITAAAIFAIVKALNKFNDLKEAAAHAAAVKAGLAAKEKQEAAPQPRLCPYCKQEIDQEATRCPHCTSKLEGYGNVLE